MIIFLYGEDSFRSREKLREMKDKFIREVDPHGESLTIINGETTDINEINRAVATASLFAAKRMVVVENIFQNKSKPIFAALEKYFFDNKAGQDNIVIFFDEESGDKLKTNKFFKYLSAQKFVQEFKALSNAQTADWIKSSVAKHGARINQAAMNHLFGLFGADLWSLSHELNKIINFKQSKQEELIKGGGELEIVVADVEKLCRGKVDENIFALTDAISQNNKPKVFEILEKEIEAGVAEQYLLTMIQRQFKILLQTRQALDSGVAARQIAKELKLHPFVVQKALGQVRNYTLLKLKKIFNNLTALDADSKTGQIDLRTGLDLMLAKI